VFHRENTSLSTACSNVLSLFFLNCHEPANGHGPGFQTGRTSGPDRQNWVAPYGNYGKAALDSASLGCSSPASGESWNTHELKWREPQRRQPPWIKALADVRRVANVIFLPRGASGASEQDPRASEVSDKERHTQHQRDATMMMKIKNRPILILPCVERCLSGSLVGRSL